MFARYIPLILSLVALSLSYKVIEEGKAELQEEVRQLTEDKEDLERELKEAKRLIAYYQEKAEGKVDKWER